MGGKPGKQESNPAVILESLFTSTIEGELLAPVLICWHMLFAVSFLQLSVCKGHL